MKTKKNGQNKMITHKGQFIEELAFSKTSYTHIVGSALFCSLAEAKKYIDDMQKR